VIKVLPLVGNEDMLNYRTGKAVGSIGSFFRSWRIFDIKGLLLGSIFFFLA
jgi:hypothetical protein